MEVRPQSTTTMGVMQVVMGDLLAGRGRLGEVAVTRPDCQHVFARRKERLRVKSYLQLPGVSTTRAAA